MGGTNEDVRGPVGAVGIRHNDVAGYRRRCRSTDLISTRVILVVMGGETGNDLRYPLILCLFEDLGDVEGVYDGGLLVVDDEVGVVLVRAVNGDGNDLDHVERARDVEGARETGEHESLPQRELLLTQCDEIIASR